MVLVSAFKFSVFCPQKPPGWRQGGPNDRGPRNYHNQQGKGNAPRVLFLEPFLGGLALMTVVNSRSPLPKKKEMGPGGGAA